MKTAMIVLVSFLLSGLSTGCSEVTKRDNLLRRSVESILQAVKLDRRRLEGFQEVAQDDDEDLLEVTFDQLPSGHNKREFDWSGQTNYTHIHRQVTYFSGIPQNTQILLL